MANYPWFPEIHGGTLGPCPAKYSAGSMHSHLRDVCLNIWRHCVLMCLVFCSLPTCGMNLGLQGEVLVQIFILVLHKKYLLKTYWEIL